MGLNDLSDDINSLKNVKNTCSIIEDNVSFHENTNDFYEEEFMSDCLANSQPSVSEEKKKMEEKAMNYEDSTTLLEELLDAHNINDISNLFELELLKNADDKEDAENVDDLTELLSQFDKDGTTFMDDNVSYLSDIDTKSTPDLELSSEISQLLSKVESTTQSSQLDSRIFVPKQIQIENSSSIQMKNSTNPFAFCIAGPPRLPASNLTSLCGKRSKTSKRKPLSEESRQNLSEVRRKRAAKRLRINGRFTQEKESFVSITKLQE